MMSDSKGKLINLVRDMLHDLRFDEGGARLVTNYSIPFYICHEMKDADAHVCLMHKDIILMPVIVRESSEGEFADNVGPQTFATSIAVFQQNNIARERAGLPKLSRMEIPCISFVDTKPMLYRIPVTAQLEYGIANGKRPKYPTNFVQHGLDEFRSSRGSMKSSDPMEDVILCVSKFKDKARQMWSCYDQT